MESERSQIGSQYRISVIVPAINEAARLAQCLIRPLQGSVEVIVVDGGSSDDTAKIAEKSGAKVVHSSAGRALQMNAGAELACGNVLLFLHADTELPEQWSSRIDEVLMQGSSWGRFDVDLVSPRRSIRLVGFMMNWRSRVSGIATGDQAMFVSRSLWQQSGGYARIALMEDIELSQRLKRLGGAPACLRARVRVSARRWESRGVLRTILQMWRLRALYFFGVSPDKLHHSYYGSVPAKPSRWR